MQHPVNQGDARSWRPGFGEVVVVQFLLALAYAIAVIVALNAPNTRLAAWVGGWVRAAHPALTPFYAVAGAPGCGGHAAGPPIARAWDYYNHLLAVSLILVALCFVGSAALWRDWAGRLHAWMVASRWRPARRRRELLVGWGLLVWAAIAALWFLTVGAGLFDSAGHCAHLNPWLFLRVPVLSTALLGLASAAATFRTAGRRRSVRNS